MSPQLKVLSSVTKALSSSLPVGINPFWKLSFVFKCLTDSVVLDDFKTALDRLRTFKITRLGSLAAESPENGRSQPPGSANVRKKEEMIMPSPDGDKLSHATPWSNGRPGRNQVEASKRRDREESQLDDSSSSDVGGARNVSDSPIVRPQNSWLRDATENDYADAVREVTKSSHSDHPHTERDIGIGRAR